MRADGTERIRLTGGAAPPGDGGDYEPAWSPDGNTLAFTREIEPPSGNSRSRILLLDAETGGVDMLAVPGYVLFPSWSPDGRRLAFARLTELEEDTESEIVVAGLDGSGEQVLYRERTGEKHFSLVWEAAWSPDGTRIAFTVMRLHRRSFIRPALYVMDADGGNRHLLAHDAGSAAWSPDSQRIAFSSQRDRIERSCHETCRYRAELYVMDSDGTNLIRLTRNHADDYSPSWSPDGRRIAFASDRNYPRSESSEIYTIRPDGSCLTWLANGSPESEFPARRNIPGASSDPGGCGATRRRPVIEATRRERPPRGACRGWASDTATCWSARPRATARDPCRGPTSPTTTARDTGHAPARRRCSSTCPRCALGSQASGASTGPPSANGRIRSFDAVCCSSTSAGATWAW